MRADADHARLMNATYRHQRRIYDATRAFFLFGRDRLITELDVPEGGAVLEVACGTGRNLAHIGRRYPGAVLYGLDISSEMLRSARAKLGDGVPLAEADARDFDAGKLLGRERFDRIVLSYAVSMIPDWPRAIDAAIAHLAPGGSLHIVDFGDQAGYPAWFRRVLEAWIAKFHVTRRADFREVLEAAGTRHGCKVEVTSWFGGYAWAGVVRRRG